MSGILWLPAISGHLSNFALTGSAMLLLIGPRSFRQKTGRMKVIIVTLIFIMANLVVEGMAGGTLNGFNVLDTYDALFGVAACGIIVAVHVYMTRR